MTEPQGLQRIVGDEEDRPTSEQSRGQRLQTESGNRIQGGEGFVHEDDRPVLDKGAHESDALAHPARKVVRTSVATVRQPYRGE